MKVSDLEKVKGLEAVYPGYADGDVFYGYTSDLLSDVMGNAREKSVLITIQAHKNTIAVARLVGMNAIVLCNGREAPDDMVEAAKANSIALFATDNDQFIVSYLIAVKLRGE